MKLNNKYFSCIFLLFFHNIALAQDVVPSNYYMFPIQPGQQNFLAGTMGELRPNHFHAGIDIKTGGVNGLQVFASADGYVSRINVNSYGYGNALYLQHPNGTTTVYAHLQDFNESIGEFVTQEQYKRESFAVEIYPSKDQFPVQQGDIIALSGNSGSSGGPHLHFEIRDAYHKPLNPLRYDFKEIEDNIPPTIQKLAVKTLDMHSRVNGQFGRFEFELTKKDGQYVIETPIEIEGDVGFEILAYDRLNGVGNRNGVPCIDLYKGQEKVFSHDINTFSFAESRNILVHTNYEVSQRTGRQYTKLYKDDGNELDFYPTLVNNGIISLQDNALHPMEIKLSDAYENSSTLSFTIKNGEKKHQVSISNPYFKEESGFLAQDNTLLLYAKVKNGQSHLAKIYAGYHVLEVAPDYEVNNAAVYLWDLGMVLPDSAELCGEKINFDFQIMVPSGVEIDYFHPALDIHFPKRALYDTAYLQVKYDSTQLNDQEFFIVNDYSIPFRINTEITLKPKLDYNEPEKTNVYAVAGNGALIYEGGAWDEEKIVFKTRNFGKFTLAKDSLPPTIKPVKFNKDELRFYIRDDLSGLNNYAARIDGKWILMNYDHKRRLIWSEKLDKTIPYSGELILTVVDNAGNENIFKTNL